MEKVQKSKQQEPTASALYKLASYFGESSDYLPGLQEYKQKTQKKRRDNRPDVFVIHRFILR